MIYLDNAATTKVYKSSANLLVKYCTDNYFNPSSVYKEGVEVKNAIKKASVSLASLINCSSNELTFTSGATEANNLIIQGLLSSNKKSEYIFSVGEHSSVHNVANYIKNKGYNVHFVDLLPNGQVDIKKLKSLVNENTALVSVIHVNNETGAINDLKTIAEEVKAINPKTLVHSDGVQAFCKIKVNVKAINVDAYVFTGHKVHGPKGVGAMYVKKGINLKPIILGGGQQAGIRSGTENVAGIMAFVNSASTMHSTMQTNFDQVKRLKQTFINSVSNKLEEIQLNSLGEAFSPYILSLSIKGIRGEILLYMLQKEGVLISTGSSCSSNSKRTGNRVLESMNINSQYITGSVRVSFSELNTLEEIEKASKIFVNTVQLLKNKIK